ncbi:sigma 54-interacting transcriptional regulator [Paraburkholderia caledonica]|uniref:sigma 54-interacting transcriptional regulator n=1 Tax=Paraburkholderia caledonica TaxID=134536 RepID=UPI0038B91452
MRVVAATNLDRKNEIRAGRLREDPYFRLNVFQIRVPSLRERREDPPVLLFSRCRSCLRCRNANAPSWPGCCRACAAPFFPVSKALNKLLAPASNCLV